MHRAILEACLPCVAALIAALAVLCVLVRLSGARLKLGRLRRLHACQQGGVQSLAFVLTVPLFIVIVLFIVQVSQLMVGVVTVHYAAFAAARAASVWIPAQIGSDPLGPASANRVAALQFPRETGDRLLLGPLADHMRTSRKLEQIRTAAVMGCAPIGPSRDLGIPASSLTPPSREAARSAPRMYNSLVPTSAQNRRIDDRLRNKIAWSDLNTQVLLEWRDARRAAGRNTLVGPTYNPFNHPLSGTNLDATWEAREVGWQDPVTVHVVHRFALLPGPGRLLARPLTGSGVPDRVSPRIQVDRGSYSEPVYTTPISASVTIVNEGLKSVRPFVHDAN